MVKVLSNLGMTTSAEVEKTSSTSTKHEYSLITTMKVDLWEEVHRNMQQHVARDQIGRDDTLSGYTRFLGVTS